MGLDAHEKPSDGLKALFKKYQKATKAELAEDVAVVDFGRGLTSSQRPAFEEVPFHVAESLTHSSVPAMAYACKALPGLVVVPSLLTTECQMMLLDKLLHRDLSNPAHKTNVHFHHSIDYPPEGGSLFELEPDDITTVLPLEGSGQKPISMDRFLNKRLRWVTLGGQYDWTNKVYPSEPPPPFPDDVRRLLQSFFPGTRPEAAILNFYSPGDVLSLHRDVSEHCDNGLVSLSIGCDGLFIVALEGGDDGHRSSDSYDSRIVLRLHSGDAVYMDGKSRFAWHGVPHVVAGTCPAGLSSWPAASPMGSEAAAEQSYKHWPSWLASKRINLNVRQMWE